jgi:hypothetical protein
VWETAPYLHDGSAPTLLDVLTTANPNNRHGNTALNDTELQELVAYLQQLDATGDTPPDSLITNLAVADTANAADWSIQANLQVNNLTYGDRTFTFTAVPALVAGTAWIRTANDSKTFTGNPTVSFSLTSDADVYVGFNDTAPRPTWVDATWTDTGVDLVSRETSTTSRPYSLFRKRFAAGQVSLGAWNSSASMYTVLVKR